MKVELHDSFNDVLISSHRSLEAAVKAQASHQRAVKRANGSDAYLTYRVTVDGEALDESQYDWFQDALLNEQNRY